MFFVVSVVSIVFFTTEDTMPEMEQLSGRVIGCAIEVHRYLGPGLLESTYESCLTHELLHSGVAFKRQWALPVEYKGVRLDCGHRIDFLVGDAIVLEVKSVESLNRVHEAQVLTYLKLSGMRIGLLMNFNVIRLKEGIRRFVL